MPLRTKRASGGGSIWTPSERTTTHRAPKPQPMAYVNGRFVYPTVPHWHSKYNH